MASRRPTPQLGDVWESRDEQYEPGRRVQLIASSPEAAPPGSNPVWSCQTIANPSRPHRVGSIAGIREATLVRRWRFIARGLAPAPDGGEGA